MDGPFQVFTPAYGFIEAKLDQFLSTGASQVSAAIAGPMRAAVVLYVLLYGIAILRGAISEPLMDFAVRSVKLALIYMLATTVAYGTWVTEPLFHILPDTLSQAISGATGRDAGAAFDQFFTRAAYLGQNAAQKTTIQNWIPLVVGGLVFISGALAAALGFGIVMLSQVALALLIALGPIFIGCALFDASRRYFFGWLSQAVNYLVLFTLIIAVAQLILALVAAQWVTLDGQDPVAGGLMFIAFCVLGGVFFLQIPAIAAGIAGGASAGLADFGHAMSRRSSGRSAADGGGGQTQIPREGGSLRLVRAKV